MHYNYKKKTMFKIRQLVKFQQNSDAVKQDLIERSSRAV